MSLSLQNSRLYSSSPKLRLSSRVVFLCHGFMSFATNGNFIWTDFLLLMLGGFPRYRSSTHFNQSWKDLDKLMTRTVNRPLPTGRMSVSEGDVGCYPDGYFGVAIFLKMNPFIGVLSLLSFFICGSVYPTKQESLLFLSWSVRFREHFLIARLGCCKKNEIEPRRIGLYSIQFIWQFPHFGQLPGCFWWLSSRF